MTIHIDQRLVSLGIVWRGSSLALSCGCFFGLSFLFLGQTKQSWVNEHLGFQIGPRVTPVVSLVRPIDIFVVDTVRASWSGDLGLDLLVYVLCGR